MYDDKDNPIEHQNDDDEQAGETATFLTVLVAEILVAYTGFGLTRDDPSTVIRNALAMLIGVGSFAFLIVRFYKALRFSGSKEGFIQLFALIASALVAYFLLPLLINSLGGY